ncbi:MAG: tetratricopeptide repeat protein [Bryobacteraceae bacterium]
MTTVARNGSRHALFLVLALLLSLAGHAEPQSQALIDKSQRGKDLMAEHKFAEAVPIYRELVQAVPDNPGLLLNLGMALHLAGRSREAIAPLAHAIKLDPDILPAWLFLGACYLSAGDPERSLEPLERYIRLQPDDPGGHQTLGDALLATSKLRQAVSQYKKLAELEVNNPHAWYGLNRGYAALADAAFQTVEKDAPQSAWWFALIADERVKRRQLRSAFFFYKKAEATQPNLPGLHASIALVYEESGHPDWAKTERQKDASGNCTASIQACDFLGGRFEEVIQRGGTTVEAYYWQSRAFARLAQSAFEHLENLPDSPEIHELRAEQLRARRQNLESANEWRKALAFAPNDERLREELLSSLYRAKDYAAALKLVDELLRENPKSAELNFMKGDILLSSQDAAKAIPYVETALKLKPNLLVARAALGRAYMQAGRQPNAIPHLQAALSIDEDGSLRYQLARAYQATGQTALAKKTLEDSAQQQKADREEKSKLEQEMKITPP